MQWAMFMQRICDGAICARTRQQACSKVGPPFYATCRPSASLQVILQMCTAPSAPHSPSLRDHHSLDHCAGNGGFEEKSRQWSDVKVGDVLKLHDGELVPADLLCLHCALDERICYVTTTNLDGETNLKVKRCAARAGALVSALCEMPAPELKQAVWPGALRITQSWSTCLRATRQRASVRRNTQSSLGPCCLRVILLCAHVYLASVQAARRLGVLHRGLVRRGRAEGGAAGGV